MFLQPKRYISSSLHIAVKHYKTVKPNTALLHVSLIVDRLHLLTYTISIPAGHVPNSFYRSLRALLSDYKPYHHQQTHNSNIVQSVSH